MSRIAGGSDLRQREPRICDTAHLRRIRKLPCIACAVRGVRTWPVEAAHVKVGYPEAGWRAFGHSERSHDSRALPLCAADHRTGLAAQHGNHGGDERAYWERLGIFPPAICQALVDAFAAGQPGIEVIQRFAAAARIIPR